MASVEALWTAEFLTANGWVNGGVVVLETTRIYGGDSQYYYVGTFSLGGIGINADLTVTHYTGQALTAWGDATQTLKITLQGQFVNGRIEGEMIRAGFPNLPFRLTKRAELP